MLNIFNLCFRSLCKLNEIAGTIFIFLHLTGNISPFDLSRLIDQTKKGSLRIFMTFSAALVSSLSLIGKVSPLPGLDCWRCGGGAGCQGHLVVVTQVSVCPSGRMVLIAE